MTGGYDYDDDEGEDWNEEGLTDAVCGVKLGMQGNSLMSYTTHTNTHKQPHTLGEREQMFVCLVYHDLL